VCQRHHSLLALVKLLSAVLLCLVDIQQDGNATSKNAASLLNSSTSSTTLVLLAVADNSSSLATIDNQSCCRASQFI